MTDLFTGMKIPDVATMEELPMGSAVTRQDRHLAIRRNDGWATPRNLQERHPAEHYWWEGMEVAMLPVPFPYLADRRYPYTGLMEGDPITTQQEIGSLPRATLLITPSGDVEKFADDYYVLLHRGSGYDGAGMWREFGGQKVTVKSLPIIRFETPEQFAWRFRDLSIVGDERVLGSTLHAIPTLEQLKVEFRPTPTMRITNTHDRYLLPEGARVYTGDPDMPESFGLFVHTPNKTWNKVFGGPKAETPGGASAIVVDSIGDQTEPDEWFVREPTVEDLHALRVLRAKVWKAAYQTKRQNRWCEEFERIMLRGGLTRDSANVPFPNGVQFGDAVPAEEAARLPEGTIFRVSNDDGRPIAVYQRSENSRNRARTVRLWGAEGVTGNYAKSMVVVSDGTHGLGMVGSLTGLRWDRELALMPPGTQITTDDRTCFERVPPEQERGARCWALSLVGSEVTSELGQYRNDAFSTGYHYCRIGGA